MRAAKDTRSCGRGRGGTASNFAQPGSARPDRAGLPSPAQALRSSRPHTGGNAPSIDTAQISAHWSVISRSGASRKESQRAPIASGLRSVLRVGQNRPAIEDGRGLRHSVRHVDRPGCQASTRIRGSVGGYRNISPSHRAITIRDQALGIARAGATINTLFTWFGAFDSAREGFFAHQFGTCRVVAESTRPAANLAGWGGSDSSYRSDVAQPRPHYGAEDGGPVQSVSRTADGRTEAYLSRSSGCLPVGADLDGGAVVEGDACRHRRVQLRRRAVYTYLSCIEPFLNEKSNRMRQKPRPRSGLAIGVLPLHQSDWMRFRVNMKIAMDALVGSEAGQGNDLLLFLLGFFRGGLLRRLSLLRFLGHEPSVNPVK